jgi:hypothetical protein
MQCVNQVIFTTRWALRCCQYWIERSRAVATLFKVQARWPVSLWVTRLERFTITLFHRYRYCCRERGACLASNLQVQVLRPMSNTVRQIAYLRCTNVNDITLLILSGAVDFIGYTCDGENEEPHNCFVDLDLCWILLLFSFFYSDSFIKSFATQVLLFQPYW